MYLKEIRAQGFKSFADNVVIEFDEGITGIVGPNGSGKSNVVDAVRWVLGEQSIKELRGDVKTDVIFSGSNTRKELNVASVTLVFDNSDHYLASDYNEVSVKRRVYRDGTNEYFLNNEKCRYKDIQEIFLDTGVGKDSFNIVSQGKIAEILTDKPQDRRFIFEEAAGVLKYKTRKIDSLRKLERTHDNMDRVEDIIAELERQVMPLKEQKEKALEYLSVKEDLEKIEVAVLANDIKEINDVYKAKKVEIEKLNNELLSLNTSNSGNEAKITDLKVKIDALNSDLSNKQRELLNSVTNVEKINSRKNIILERKKYEVDNTKLHTNLVDVKEKILKVTNDIDSTKKYIETKRSELTSISLKCKEKENDITKLQNTRVGMDKSLSSEYKRQNILKNKIDVLKENIESNSLLPNAVKMVLNSPKLMGIQNVLGNILEIDEEYSNAISTALGANSSNIIVDNEMYAKEAISFLKNNNYGRATFFPLNIIKSKSVDAETLSIAKTVRGYIDVASRLVSYEKRYEQIVENQLGNVLVVKDIDTANILSKKINYRYRVVTLDGNILHVGGSITGGAKQNNKSVITLKYELETLLQEYKKVEETISKIEDDINITDASISSESDKLYLLTKNKNILSDDMVSKENSLSSLNDILEDLNHEVTSINNMLGGSLDREEDEVIKEYYAAVKVKDDIESAISSLTSKRDLLKEELDEYEHSLKIENSNYNNKTRELNNLEVEVNRMDVKLDNMLNVLNETYSMTYEKATRDYVLTMPIEEARTKVSSLRRKLKDIGMVNLNAIDEYDVVAERYEFLIKKKEELTDAEQTLLDIIDEMDEVMKEEFVKTFEIVRENFKETFKELFKGGTADLKMTDPDNVLETGIEIEACPPGKKLKSISLLSGGEKTFTAISLLFAILKSRTIPFYILDEVEAALDDANVSSFGKYIDNISNKTQFILITHKKKTMEYVKNLYGITMQESGVSKLVSVKLADIGNKGEIME